MEKTSINTRIKEIRKTLRLKQIEFGEAIGVKDSAIGRMEQEGSNVTEQSIMLICKEFKVRREWLVDGEGEMFYEGEPALFQEFVKQHKLNKAEQAAIKYFLGLSDSDRTIILEHLRGMAAAMDAARSEEKAELDRAAALHRQVDEGLAAEKKAAAASASIVYGKKA